MFRLPPKRPRIHQLFVLFHGEVRLCLLQAGLDEAEVDDEMQSVFDIAIRRYSRIPLDDKEAKAWLLRVASNRAKNWLKVRTHRRLKMVHAALSLKLAQTDNWDPETHLANVVLVRDSAAALSEEDQEILFRHFAFGESFASIARRLGISKSGAHLRVRQARDLFVEKLARVSEVRRKSFSFVPSLFFLAALFRDPLFRDPGAGAGFFSRFSLLGRLFDPVFLGLRLAPVVVGPTLGILLGVMAPRTAFEPPSSPVVLRAQGIRVSPSSWVPSAAGSVESPLIPPRVIATALSSAVASAVASVSVYSGSKGSTPALPALPEPGEPVNAEEQMLYDKIMVCSKACASADLLALILKYQAAHPHGKHYAEVTLLQRLRMGGDPQTDPGPGSHP